MDGRNETVRNNRAGSGPRVSVMVRRQLTKCILALLAFTLLITEGMLVAYTLRGQDPPFWAQNVDHIFNCISNTVSLINILYPQDQLEHAIDQDDDR